MLKEKYYTWNDVERKLLICKDCWPIGMTEVEVYSSELIIYLANSIWQIQVEDFLKDLFGKYYLKEEQVIRMEITDVTMEVFFEVDDEKEKKNIDAAPLFRDYSYLPFKQRQNRIPDKLPGVNVVAFHSYKGGVGRTLSVITLAKEIIEMYSGYKKVLIVDSDIEAPGLTWLAQEQNCSSEISYLDILSIIQSKGIDEDVIQNISHVIEKSVLRFNTSTMTGTHYFLPTYRLKEQVLNVYSNPQRIINGKEDKYIIVDFLSVLGKKLGVDSVVVDLRAGISEYSAPFLFDARVNKFLVSSTSYQSVFGTRLVLEQMAKMNHNENTNILLQLPNEEISISMKEEIYDSLIVMDSIQNEIDKNDENDDSLNLTDFIVEIPFASSLVHLGNLDNICEKLKQADNVTNKIKEIVPMLYPEESVEKDLGSSRKVFLQCLHDLATRELTAEGTGSSKMLTTKSLEAIGRNFRRQIPQIVILGAKGSGKTYLYKQMLYAKTWSKFLRQIGEDSVLKEEILIYPLLSSTNMSRIKPAIEECKENCAESLNHIMKNEIKQADIIKLIRERVEEGAQENEWLQFWNDLIINLFHSNCKNLEDIDEELEHQGKKIIFIIDGLEDIFDECSEKISQQKAIKALCTDFINGLLDLPYNNIGIITFLRKDIAELAIKTNFEQFSNQYSGYELVWSQQEALRLALWLADNACQDGVDEIYNNKSVPIKSAPQNVVEEALYKLWGKKMGSDRSKTAITSRWVLACLSDFNGQLQARDIVRFLKHASDPNSKDDKKKIDNRYLSVSKMKEAVKKCSKEKLKEINQEIKQLKPIFEKLSNNVAQDDKIVPLKEDVLNVLSQEEQDILRRYGYLKKSGEEYYIPECIRYALDYNKTRRGGIKIVSLLVQR